MNISVTIFVVRDEANPKNVTWRAQAEGILNHSDILCSEEENIFRGTPDNDCSIPFVSLQRVVGQNTKVSKILFFLFIY